MMIYASLLTAALLVATDTTAAKPATATVRQSGKDLKFSAGLQTYIEGVTLAMLGSCSVGLDSDKERWSRALQSDHVRIVYPKPRAVGVSTGDGDKVLQVSEIVMPMSAEKLPDFILIRQGNSHRRFSKYAPQEAMLLRDFLN